MQVSLKIKSLSFPFFVQQTHLITPCRLSTQLNVFIVQSRKEKKLCENYKAEKCFVKSGKSEAKREKKNAKYAELKKKGIN